MCSCWTRHIRDSIKMTAESKFSAYDINKCMFLGATVILKTPWYDLSIWTFEFELYLPNRRTEIVMTVCVVSGQKGWQSRSGAVQVLACMCVCEMVVGRQCQQTVKNLWTPGGTNPHTSPLSVLSHTHTHTRAIFLHSIYTRLGKLRQTACSVATWVTGWSEKKEGRELKQQVQVKGQKLVERSCFCGLAYGYKPRITTKK